MSGKISRAKNETGNEARSRALVNSSHEIYSSKEAINSEFTVRDISPINNDPKLAKSYLKKHVF
jgi:hypothetical protein